MTTSDNRTLWPTNTTHAIRLVLFQPTRRPLPLRSASVDTPWGKVKIWGRLGQQHADVLEAICYEREKRADMEDGRIKLLVDPAKVRRRSMQASGSTFAAVLKDIEQAVIEIIEPERLACSGHLIDHVDKAIRADGRPITRRDPLTGGERPLWRVEIGKALCKLVDRDIWLGYDPAQIASLECGISQAVVRHIMTHKNAPSGGWRMDALISAVSGQQVDGEALRNRRRELHNEAAKMAEMGIVIDGDRVLRVKLEKRCAAGGSV